MRMICVYCILVGTALGQNAQISGIIQDSSDTIIAGAIIGVRNDQTGGKRTTQSNQAGIYSVPSLKPGLYRISVQAQGFETEVRDGVQLEVAQNVRIDFTLRVGAERTTITVESGPRLVNTEDASVGTVIGREFIDALPLNGRGIETLVDLTPGVVVTPTNYYAQGQFSVDGQRPNANYFTVDGISANFPAPYAVQALNQSNFGYAAFQSGSGSLPANSILGTFSNLVSTDALQEFKIQTSTFTPEFGRSPGAQISLITRSGTNQYAGVLFEYLRNDWLDANDWFANQLATGKAPLLFNDFGGTVGGPVRLPGLYDGHNRTFFFFSAENLIVSQPQEADITVPSVAARNGAPASMKPLLDAYPLPNGPPQMASDGTLTGAAGLRTGYPDQKRQQTYGIRLDHYFTERLAFFARYNYAPSLSLNRNLGDPANIERFSVPTSMLTFGLTVTLSSRLVNETRFGISGQRNQQSLAIDQFEGAKQPSQSLLFPPSYSPADSAFVFDLGLEQADYEIGVGLGSLDRSQQVQFVDNWSYVTGKHEIRTGIDYRLFSPQLGYPRLELNAGIYGMYGDAGVYSGRVQDLSVQTFQAARFVVPAFSAFAQDTWKITPRFTATYGLRWEVLPAPRPAGSTTIAEVQGFDSLTDFAHLCAAPSGTPFYPTSFTNVAPRLGVAWQLFNGVSTRTVLRAGAGRFYDLAQTGFTDNALQLVSSTSYSGVALPFGSSPASAVQVNDPMTQTPVAAAPGYRLPRIYEWNLALEQAFGPQSLSALYIGSVGRGLIAQASAHFSHDPQSTQYPDTPVIDDLVFLGNAASSSYHSMQLQFRRRLARQVQTLVSYTWSHSLDDLSNDISLGIFSTLGLDNYLHLKNDRGSSDFDTRHSLSGAVVFSPTVSSWTGWRRLLGGWSANSIFFARSAMPTDIIGDEGPGPLFSPRRPDVVPGEPLYLWGSQYPGGKRFNPTAFQPAATGLLNGDLGRNVLRGFAAWQIDGALHRNFPLSARNRIEFRAEVFNVLNHPNFANPVYFGMANQNAAWLASPTFGVSNATLAQGLGAGSLGSLDPLFQIGGPRTFQLALRFHF